MKIAFVVQRYGLEISGGAELHCRWIAEHMSKHWQVEVLTTRAYDYITWKNHYHRGQEIINGLPVRRFSVAKKRDPRRFGHIQSYILNNKHSRQEELKWLEEEGPYSPQLIQYIEDKSHDYDYFIFFSYRYYHSFWGIEAVPDKSILVPTAEHDSVIYLDIFRELFNKPQAIIYNSEEERKLINSVADNDHILGEVVGVGTEIPPFYSAQKFRQDYLIKGNYVLYLGRIDENKGCGQLFDYFLRFKRQTCLDVKLVLIGSTVLKIPSHPDILYFGFVSDEDKFSALAGALFLVMPSFYESLSMVTLEAWAAGKPVLANGRCEVLKGQCLRSNAGLFYENYDEFSRAFQLLLSSSRLRQALGANGRNYYLKRYRWDIIEKKYLSIVAELEERKK
ncbi:MAG: glycosyltransferase family 4 protein [Candidatus Aminicenantales bacterium]